MPKIKTHKATAKRFKYSGKKKLLRTRGGAKSEIAIEAHAHSRLARSGSRGTQLIVGQPLQVGVKADGLGVVVSEPRHRFGVGAPQQGGP